MAWQQLASYSPQVDIAAPQMEIGDPQMDTTPEHVTDEQNWDFVEGEDMQIEDPVLDFLGSVSSLDG